MHLNSWCTQICSLLSAPWEEMPSFYSRLSPWYNLFWLLQGLCPHHCFLLFSHISSLVFFLFNANILIFSNSFSFVLPWTGPTMWHFQAFFLFFFHWQTHSELSCHFSISSCPFCYLWVLLLMATKRTIFFKSSVTSKLPNMMNIS